MHYLQNTNPITTAHIYRQTTDHPFAQIPPPEHPTFDLYKVINAALEEDAGDLGDVTTLSTYASAVISDLNTHHYTTPESHKTLLIYFSPSLKNFNAASPLTDKPRQLS